MEGLLTELLDRALFGWMTREDLAMLANCFDLREERLAAGDYRVCGGRMGYLLSGTAADEAGRPLEPGDLLGVPGVPTPESFTASEGCRILWMDGEIMTSVCYRACWFHGRFVTEVRKRLGLAS